MLNYYQQLLSLDVRHLSLVTTLQSNNIHRSSYRNSFWVALVTDEETSISFLFAHATTEQTKHCCCFSCSNSPKTVLMKYTQNETISTAYKHNWSIINNSKKRQSNIDQCISSCVVAKLCARVHHSCSSVRVNVQ